MVQRFHVLRRSQHVRTGKHLFEGTGIYGRRVRYYQLFLIRRSTGCPRRLCWRTDAEAVRIPVVIRKEKLGLPVVSIFEF